VVAIHLRSLLPRLYYLGVIANGKDFICCIRDYYTVDYVFVR
jgi:hypothetical protein